MRRHGDTLPVFLQARAAVILAQALIARAGGPEKLLVTVLGPERARQVYAPILWMDRVRQGVGVVSLDKVASGAGETLDAAKAAGSKGFEALKQKLGGGSDATVGPAPH